MTPLGRNVGGIVKKVVKVEYDAAATIEKRNDPAPEAWQPFLGSLSGPAGEDFARVIDEMFPAKR